MPPRRQPRVLNVELLKNEAKKHHAKVSLDVSFDRVVTPYVYAQEGYIWSASSTHALYPEPWRRGVKAEPILDEDNRHAQASIAAALQDMAEGVERCVAEDCDECAEIAAKTKK
jgi:hypothetical protein